MNVPTVRKFPIASELLKEERQIDLARHWLLRSFKVTLTFQRFLQLPVIFNKDDDNSNNNDNEVFSFFSLRSLCRRWVYFYFVFSHIAPPARRFDPPGSYNGSQLSPTWIRKTISFRLGNATFSDSHKITRTPRGRMRVYMHTYALTLTHNNVLFFDSSFFLFQCFLLFSAAAVYLIFIGMLRLHWLV